VHLVDREDEDYCFRLHKDRVYYVSETSMRLASSIARPNLMSFGTVLGKFSKNGKFKLHITALDYLAQYAKYKVGCCRHNYSETVIESLDMDQTKWRNAIYMVIIS
jgi:ribosome biogenesis protein Nip4